MGAPEQDTLPRPADLDLWVRAEQIRMVYLYSPTTTGASLFAGAFLVWVMWDVVPRSSAYLWSAFLLVHQAVRIIHYRRYLRANPGPAASPRWGRLYIGATVTAGFIWGSAGILFYVPDSSLHQAYLCLILFGIASLTIPTLSIFAVAFYPMVVLALTPFIVKAFTSGDPHQAGLAIPLIIVLVAAITFGHRLNRMVDESIRRRFDNLNLIAIAEQARGEAEAGSRAKSQFLAMMSHELRTPLNAIIGYSELMTRYPARFQTASAQEPLARVLRAGRHLLNIINDLLDVAKIEAGKLSLVYGSVAIPPVLEEVVETTKGMAEQNRLVVSTTCAPDLAPVRTDRKRLFQVLLNLVSNACKFTKDGRVDLTVSLAEEGGQRWLEIAVSDTGIGIAPEQIASIFQDFTQGDAATQQKFGGTGLGLAISRRLCRMMGGSLTAVSETGRGSTFTLRLPAGADAAEAAAGDVPGGGPERIADAKDAVLIIDADPIERVAIRSYLAAVGMRIANANGGIEGLQAVRDFRPAAIVLDSILPDLSGWSVLAAVKSDPDLASIPVVVMAPVADHDKARRMGAAGCLAKPVERDRLVAAVVALSGTNGRHWP